MVSSDARFLPHPIMQTSRTAFSASVICFCLVISLALTNPVSNMEGDAAASEEPIRQSPSLCAGEQEYIHKRKGIVLDSLNRLGINCTAIDSVPHIALLGSGGGQRAAVGLVGSLYQMKQDGLLDTLLYLGGVSGATWSMSSLYSDPQWSTDMDNSVSKLSSPGVELEEAMAWLGTRSQEENFDLSDIWGVLTSAGYMKQMDLRRLSDEFSRNATNPYPLYCAIEHQCFSTGPIEGKWFEMSPHEAGFTELDVFVKTSSLGSTFEGGKLLEKKSEMDMVRLQGVLGSALADTETLREFVPNWVNVTEQIDSAAEKFLRVYHLIHKVVSLTRSIVKEPAALSDLDNLQKILNDKVNHNDSALLESKSPEERKILFQQWSLQLLQAMETWSQTLEDGPFKSNVSLLIRQIIPPILKWEWGTTRNFLYQYQDSAIPMCLRSEKTFHLIDAGLLINVAYPSFLGDKRDIDLIIAPEYSAGNIFETLTLARDYAAQVGKPFPEIDDKILEEREWPKDCYVFEGKEKQPTIIYMPLFNRRNCKDAEEIKEKMELFSTIRPPFSQEMIEFVLETAKENIKNNKETLLREIYNASVRRENKSRTPLQCQKAESCLFGLV